VMMMSSVSVMAYGVAGGLKIGTLGLGAEATVGLGDKTNVRME